MQEIMTALITPFQGDGSIDKPALIRLIKEQLHDGIDGFIVCGTTAETPTLSEQEKREMLDLVIDTVDGKAAIWYGCGTNCTQTTINACRAVEDKAISGVLLVTPYYNRPSQEGVYQHFSTIASQINQNIMLYNIPSRTGCSLEAETLLRLIKHHSNIKALKHASNDLSLVEKVLAVHPEFKIYSGEDGSFDEGFDLGMCGVVSVMSHVVAKAMKSYIANGRKDPCLKRKLKACASITFMEASPAPIKYMMHVQKRCENTLRLPMVAVSKQSAKQIEQWMAESDILYKAELIK